MSVVLNLCPIARWQVAGVSSGRPEQPFIDHVKRRFQELRTSLAESSSIQVTIASEDGLSSSLGKGLAVGQWQTPQYGEEAYQRFIKVLDDETVRLHTDFPDRVRFGWVSGANASPIHLQVWGANSKNWNLKAGATIKGDGQAACMGTQKMGVFGVVTTPYTGIPSDSSAHANDGDKRLMPSLSLQVRARQEPPFLLALPPASLLWFRPVWLPCAVAGRGASRSALYPSARREL